MDKIMSTRMDEAMIQQIGMLAKRLGTSKKAILESAVRHYADKVEADFETDVLAHTCGCWRRNESASETIRAIKETMRTSQERYKR